MVNVIVIGAGVVGASVAYRLTQAGAAVTILEARRVGGGTSGASFAWTNSNGKMPRAYHDLNVAGMRGHLALREEFGGAPWLHNTGNIEWVASESGRAAQREKVERLRAWGYSVEWITLKQLAELEPDVDPAAVGDAPIAFYRDEGWIDPVLYAHAMVEAAVRRGARLHCQARVTQVRVSGGRVTGVQIASGQTFGADVVVNCAGPWADEVAELAGVRLPMAPTVGLIAITAPVATCLQRIIHAPQCHIRPDGAGRLMLHKEAMDKTVTAETSPSMDLPAVRGAVPSAAAVLPGLAGVAPEAARIAVRSIPADGHPAVGPVPGVEGYYVAVTHSGVTLAPVLAEAAAAEIVRGNVDPRLEPFRPARLIKEEPAKAGGLEDK